MQDVQTLSHAFRVQLKPASQPAHPYAFMTSIVALVFLLGCHKHENLPSTATTNSPAPSVALSNTLPGHASSLAAPTSTTNALPVEAQITTLAAPFKTAPPETQARIDDALQTFKAGKKREAITKLKLVDADTALSAEQQQSVKELIIIFRQ